MPDNKVNQFLTAEKNPQNLQSYLGRTALCIMQNIKLTTSSIEVKIVWFVTVS